MTCPKCNNSFDSLDTANKVTPWVAAMALGTGGAIVGASFGLATGGWGVAATIPFGAAGVTIGFLGAKNFRRCPNCSKVFRI
jgi:hypothetical protein